MNNPPNGQKRLVVLIPGLHSHSSRWNALRDRLDSEPGFRKSEALWVPFDHGSKIYSFGGLEREARKLQALIDGEWSKVGGYEDIVIVAHSIGGPIAREAYLMASGASLDARASKWSQRVSRILLFASINRGVDTQKIWWLRPVAWIVRNFPVLSSLRIVDIYRGSDFLTNLRIKWIRHFARLAEEQNSRECWPDGREKRLPKVIQLLGTEDGLVTQGDSKDVLSSQEAYDISVFGANHNDIYRLEVGDVELRYSVIRDAFCAESFASRPAPESQRDIRRVIFVLHGIRASNVDGWIKDIEKEIERRDSVGTIVIHPTYGYFSAAQFILPSVRRRNITTFQDWYTEALSEYPMAEYSIIAHSNGTYIVGYSLVATPEMRFANIALAGSVLPRNFWQSFEGARLKYQAKRIQNHRANRDVPVALLCSALRGLRMRDIGTGGFAGFNGHRTGETAYYKGGHGEALRPANQASLVDFVFGYAANEPDCLEESPGIFRQVSNAAPYAAIVAVFALAAGLGCFVLGFDGIDGVIVRGGLVAATFAAVYVILDVI